MKSPPHRFAGLDALRAVAVVAVLFRHCEVPSAADGANPALWAAAALRRGGWVGVDLFFVLSGFLVSGLLFREAARTGSIAVGRFYMRRAWKIYPAFYAMIGAAVALEWAAGRPPGRSAVASELLFLQGYVPGVVAVTWSLAVEEHFYLLVPLLLAALLRAGRGNTDPFRPVPAVAAATAVACLTLRLLTAKAVPGFSYQTHLFPTHLRIDSLMAGVAIAYGYWYHRPAMTRSLGPHRRSLIVAGSLALVPAFVWRVEACPAMYTVGLTLFALGSGAIVAGLVLAPPGGGRIVAALGYVGRRSYSVYLWHLLVRDHGVPALARLLPFGVGGPVRLALYLAGSLLVGIVAAAAVEIPMLKARDRWFPAR